MEEPRILRPQGRIDSSNSSAFEKEVQASMEATKTLLIDLSDLQYISSAGLRVLLAAAKRMKAAGARLALCSLNAQIAEVFKISGFNMILSIHPSAEIALAQLAAG